MADKFISDLTATTSLSATDEMELDNGTNSRKITIANLATELKRLSGWVAAGTGQTATGVYDFAVDGAKANIDFVGLANYHQLLVIARGLTDGTSGVRQLLASVDNGSSFYTASGDYKNLTTAGVENNVTAFAFHNTATTAARSMVAHVLNTRGNEKICVLMNDPGGFNMFTASASDINAIRVNNSGGGNITAGTVRVFGR
jgi:hypothetical protein